MISSVPNSQKGLTHFYQKKKKKEIRKIHKDI